MANRLLRDSILTSESIDVLSAEAERLFYRLLLIADDWGRFDADVRVLISRCFPLKVGDITRTDTDNWLKEIEDAGMVVLYSVDGRRYAAFSNWSKHNRLRNLKSKFPAPPGASDEPQAEETAENRKQPQATASNCRQMSAYTDTDTDTDTESNTETQPPNPQGVSLAALLPPELRSEVLADAWSEYLGYRMHRSLGPPSQGMVSELAQRIVRLKVPPDRAAMFLRFAIGRGWKAAKGEYLERWLSENPAPSANGRPKKVDAAYLEALEP
jgi:hypothetical protein